MSSLGEMGEVGELQEVDVAFGSSVVFVVGGSAVSPTNRKLGKGSCCTSSSNDLSGGKPTELAVFANAGPSEAADFIVVGLSTNEPLSKGSCGELSSANEMSGGGKFCSFPTGCLEVDILQPEIQQETNCLSFLDRIFLLPQ